MSFFKLPFDNAQFKKGFYVGLVAGGLLFLASFLKLNISPMLNGVVGGGIFWAAIVMLFLKEYRHLARGLIIGLMGPICLFALIWLVILIVTI